MTHEMPAQGTWTIEIVDEDRLYGFAFYIAEMEAEYEAATAEDGDTLMDAANARWENVADLIAAAPTMADYIEYVDAKVDIGEVPFRFAQWQDFNAAADAS